MQTATQPKAVSFNFHVEDAYCQARNEEGSYDYKAGYNVFCELTYADGTRRHLFYIGREKGSQVPVLFRTKEAADRLCINATWKGSIRSECWHCYKIININDLPDYVTDPHRPEFN